ncbi:beta-lactamase 2 [Fusarium subglutinans]|uniref:Beta-lactamase 2 n=1 Tax=Gibberella subglutinans TaxID=42677 RepID=A0A8H5QAG7_GIBSU|nr:beta-lactamase 2 [Fusarium subglutinans]KAF5611204.1 beta-lactamase 2 [Fusarium subglutinans]
MRIQILGTAISAAFLGFGTAPAQALSPCPLFGPDFPIPTALGDEISLKNALSEILKLVPSLDIDFQNTSFSIDIYPAADKRPLFSYHHSAAYHGHGVQVVNDTTVYRIGSISKLLTAYVYLLEVGDVSFNQPVTRYVPELADISAKLRNKSAYALQYVDWDAVTIGALASHMAGIPRDFPSPASADHQLERLGFPPVRPVDFAYCGKSVLYPCNRTAFFDAIRTRHPSEAAFSTPIYSNIGYQIMAYALENITGTAYPDILSRQLIFPLGLNSTSYAKPANTDMSIIPDSPSSSWYDVDTRDEGPAAGIYSSIADLRKIGQSILTYEMLSPSQTRRWMKPVSFTADSEVAVGAPWEIARVPSTSKTSWMYTKGGQLGMYSSLMALLPDWGIGFTVLAAGTDAQEVVGMIPAAIVSKLVPALEQAAKRQARQSYSGRYGNERNAMTLAVQDSLPGLGVTSWLVDGHDMFDLIRLMVSESSTGSGNVSMRLYPTGLQTQTDGKTRLESWRAVYEIIEVVSSSSSYCDSWFAVDSVTYGGVSIDEFVIDLSADGTSQGITNPMDYKVVVAAVHAAPVFMNKAATTDKVIDLIEQAGKEHIELLVFPETFIPGYPYWIECYPPLQQVGALAKYADESVVVQDGDEIARISAACRRTGIAISLGVSERISQGYTLFNSQVNIDANGNLLGVHRKLQPTYVERSVWAQGGGHTLRTYKLGASGRPLNLGGLCCWEHTMNGARQALITQHEHIHAGAWPALSTMAGFEAVADSQIEALMKAHALTAQVFAITASNYVDDTCLEWMEKNLGKQEFVKAGGGWSAVIHPFCSFLAGPHTGAEEKLVKAEVDLSQLGQVKVWVDAAGHYQRPEILRFSFDDQPLWADEKSAPKRPSTVENKPEEEPVPKESV